MSSLVKDEYLIGLKPTISVYNKYGDLHIVSPIDGGVIPVEFNSNARFDNCPYASTYYDFRKKLLHAMDCKDTDELVQKFDINTYIVSESRRQTVMNFERAFEGFMTDVQRELLWVLTGYSYKIAKDQMYFLGALYVLAAQMDSIVPPNHGTVGYLGGLMHKACKSFQVFAEEDFIIDGWKIAYENKEGIYEAYPAELPWYEDLAARFNKKDRKFTYKALELLYQYACAVKNDVDRCLQFKVFPAEYAVESWRSDGWLRGNFNVFLDDMFNAQDDIKFTEMVCAWPKEFQILLWASNGVIYPKALRFLFRNRLCTTFDHGIARLSPWDKYVQELMLMTKLLQYALQLGRFHKLSPTQTTKLAKEVFHIRRHRAPTKKTPRTIPVSDCPPRPLQGKIANV